MCSFHFNSSSIIIPKTSFCLTCSISVSLIGIWRPSGIRFNFLFEAISIDLVFFVFNVNLLASSHLLKLRKSSLVCIQFLQLTLQNTSILCRLQTIMLEYVRGSSVNRLCI